MNTDEDARKLFVAGLPESVNEDVLRDLFAGVGVEAVAVSIPRDRMTGRPRGFAFVTVQTPDEAGRALADLHGHFVGGSSISVRRFNADGPARGERPVGGGPRPPRPSNADTSDRTLYVGNLPYDATQEEVETLLRESGAEAFVRVHLPVDPEGRRRGFGFVTMSTPEAAKSAVESLRGAALRSRPLIINAAQPKPPPGAGGGPGAGGPPARTYGAPLPGGSAPSPGGGPPPNRFGAPAKPGGRNDFSQRRKKFDNADGAPGGRGGGGAGAGRGGGRRNNEETWRDDDE